MYHNNGDGTFTEVSRQIGLAKPGKGLGIAIADYDRDGHIDVYVANDSMPGFLYHNKGNGTFEEVALLAGVGVTDSGRTYAGMGVDFADYNNDGLPDLAVADLALETYALYENEGKGFFKYATDSSGLGNITMQHSGMGLHFIDYDNDGWKDLLVSQGHVMDTVDQVNPNLHYREPMLLVRNTGKGFVDVSAASGEIFHQAWAGRGLAVGDINNDGRVDAVVSTSEGPAHVLLNQTPTLEPLADFEADGTPEQSRRHRCGSQSGYRSRHADGHGDHGRQLSFFQRQAGALRSGAGDDRTEGGDPLAQRDSSDPLRSQGGPDSGGG